MNDRLAHLNQTLDRLSEQLAGSENALITAEAAEKVRLRQKIEDLKAEIAEFEQEFEQEKAKLLTPQDDSNPTHSTLPPHFSSYNPATFAGRSQELADLNEYLTQADRLLVIYGMTGIGKTTLAERLAADFWEREEFRYVQVDCDRELGAKTLSSGAISILAKLGDDTAQQLPDDQIPPYLVKSLQGCWVQLDSLEALLVPTVEGAMRFADGAWLDFLEQILRSSPACRLILTSQTLPQDWDDRGVRLNRWHSYRLAGLMQAERLDLFRQYGLAPQTEAEADRLCEMANYFEGHPLILKMIAGDIQNPPFRGNIQRYWQDYWQDYYQPRRQANSSTPSLRRSQEDKARTWVQQTLAQLPDTAQQLLQWGSVFRRSVPEAFYAQRLPDLPTAALTLLLERNLLEDDGFQGGLLRQHNLIREVARAALQANREAWQAAERQAANLWLTAYEPPADAPNLEKVRGYLEAFEHFCEVEDWDAAKSILMTKIHTRTQDQVYWMYGQLGIWGCYREQIQLCERILGQLGDSSDGVWVNTLGLAYRNLGNVQRAIKFHEKGLTISRKMGDRQGEGTALGNMGNAYYRLGNYEKAIDFHQQCLTIVREIGDRQGEGAALGNLGLAYYSLGNYEKAIDFYQQCLTIAREMGDRQGEGTALGNLGNAYYSLGNYEKAIDFHQQHLTIAREIGNRRGEGNALGNLGSAYCNLGNYEKGIDFYQQHLTIAREIGDRLGEGSALGNLGNAYNSLGNYEKAIDFLQQHLTIARDIDDRRGEGIALVNMGGTQLKQKQYSESLTNNQAALAIFQEIGDRTNKAEALKNLAELHQALGEMETARQYCQQALSLATELGIPLKAECEALQLLIDN